jgi:hypothetical protein
MVAETPNLVLQVGDIAYEDGTFEQFQANFFDYYFTLLRKPVSSWSRVIMNISPPTRLRTWHCNHRLPKRFQPPMRAAFP